MMTWHVDSLGSLAHSIEERRPWLNRETRGVKTGEGPSQKRPTEGGEKKAFYEVKKERETMSERREKELLQ